MGQKCGVRAGLLRRGPGASIFQGLSFLHVQNCVMHLKKKIFLLFCHRKFMKKSHSKLSKNKPENTHKLR